MANVTREPTDAERIEALSRRVTALESTRESLFERIEALAVRVRDVEAERDDVKSQLEGHRRVHDAVVTRHKEELERARGLAMVPAFLRAVTGREF